MLSALTREDEALSSREAHILLGLYSMEECRQCSDPASRAPLKKTVIVMLCLALRGHHGATVPEASRALSESQKCTHAAVLANKGSQHVFLALPS